MPIHVALTHRTTYKYDRPTTHGPHVVRLRPAPHCRTPIISYSLKVDGGQHFLNWQQDPFPNYLARLNFEKPLTELSIEVDLVAEMAVFNPCDFFLEVIYQLQLTQNINRDANVIVGYRKFRFPRASRAKGDDRRKLQKH